MYEHPLDNSMVVTLGQDQQNLVGLRESPMGKVCRSGRNEVEVDATGADHQHVPTATGAARSHRPLLVDATTGNDGRLDNAAVELEQTGVCADDGPQPAFSGNTVEGVRTGIGVAVPADFGADVTKSLVDR